LLPVGDSRRFSREEQKALRQGFCYKAGVPPSEIPCDKDPSDPGERFFLRHHRVVNAGAGTGKTHALISQYLHLLGGLTVHGQPLLPQSICALTFTDKAAGEMRERLGQRLVGIVRALAETVEVSEPEAPAGPAAGPRAIDAGPLLPLQAVEPELVQSALALGQKLPALRHFETAREKLSTAPIGTFHSFAAALLRRHAARAALDLEFALLDEDAARDLQEEACERTILGALEGQHGEELSTATARLVAEYGFRGGAHGEGLVEALCRLAQVRAEEGRDASGLGNAYTAEFLESERRRIAETLSSALRALGSLAGELSGKSAERAEQLGATAAWVERQLAMEELTTAPAAAPAAAQAETGTEQGPGEMLAFCETLRQELGLLRAKKSKDGDGSGERLRALCEHLKHAAGEVAALHYSVHAAPLAYSLERLLGVLMAAYADHKRSAAVLDFTDLLRRARDLLRDTPAVLAIERRRYAALLIDEFQDTSPLQAEILRLLVGFNGSAPAAETGEELGAGAPGPRRLYLVGDRKQSIYGFRGADVLAYEELCQELLLSGADEETLSTSRRSRPALLAASNALFASVWKGRDARPAAAASAIVWDPARDPLRPFRPDPDEGGALVELLRGPESTVESATLIEDPLGRESRLLARRITALLAQGFRHGDIVLLLRRFTHLLRYTTALKQAGIPHYVVRGRGFYQAQEVHDIAAFLRVLDDADDRLALLALLRSPLCGLSDDSLVRLHLRGKLSLLPLLQGLPPLQKDEQERLGRLLGLVRALHRCGDRLGPAGCLSALLDHTDYLGVLYADPDGEQRVANVLRLCERARACEARGGSLRGFVRSLQLDTDPRLSELRSERDEPTAPIVSEAEDVVRVMTVHQAKGLEFPVVIVAGCGGMERIEVPAIAYDRAVGVGLKVLREGEREATLGSRRVHELIRQRTAAESGRLFYVAATRAKERLIFAGEVRRGRRAASGTWLSYLQSEALRDKDPPLLVDWQPPPPSSRSPLPLAAEKEEPFADRLGDSPVLLAAAERQVAAVYEDLYGPREGELVPTPTTAVPFQLAAAADLLSCGRRFHLRHVLRLHESAPKEAPGRDDEPSSPATALSTLAAEILDDIDWSLFKLAADKLSQTLLSLLLRRGQDVRSPAIAELCTRLLRFIHSSFVRSELASERSGRKVLRRVPYDVALSADPGSPLLRGVFDLVVIDEEKPRGVLVLEYRYGYASDGTSSLHKTRMKLLEEVARRVFLDGPAQSLKLGACYLREADPQPRMEARAAEASRPLDKDCVAAELAQAAPLSQLGNAAALRLPVLPHAVCQKLPCGFQYLCHPAQSSQRIA
jgi:ATP-dependent exoDNAse (exonuclease V) beta subunit